MGCEFDNLDGCVVAGLDGQILRERDLRKTDGSREGVVGRAEDLEARDDVVGHVGRTAVGALGAEANVDVGECSLMASEPTWLEGNGSSDCGPVCSVLSDSHTTA